jgi:NADPH2:quinone reductase
MDLPSTMRRIGVEKPGAPDAMHLETAALPVPGAGEVLVRVAAAGVNRPDIQQRKGLYPPPPGTSPVLGLEVAGTVCALGDGAARWAIGDRVCALVNGGGYAEYCAVPAVQCLPWPAGYDAIRAGALPENFFTVWANLFGHGRLGEGETVLIHGGSSGIGTVAVMLARALGARVFATAGSAAKCAACEKLGADAINYRETDFVAAIEARTGGRGVDVVLDMVAGPYLSRNISCLAKDGRLVIVAVQGGTKDPDFDVLPIMLRRLTVTGSTMRPRSTEEKGAIAAELVEKVWKLLDAGTIYPSIHAVFPLAQVADAHRLMESGMHIGKIMLQVA